MNSLGMENDMQSAKERKKELAREYKRQPKRIGAYCILNNRNQKCFVGVSRDVDARLNRHRFMLKTNSERDNAELQDDWNAHGSDAFEFSVLDVIEPPEDASGYDPNEDLEALEQLWFDQLKPFSPNGYNSNPND